MTVDPVALGDAPAPTPAPSVPGEGGASAAVVADLADTLVDSATPDSGPDNRPSDGAVLRYGKVTAVGVLTNSGRVQVDATGAAWLTYDASYGPAVNDLVYLIMQGPVAHVVGKLGGSQPTAPPVGVIHPFAGANAPTGWLLANGQAVSRTTYPQLFAVCGTTYGAGDGSTTFNVPNLVDRMPTGSGSKFVRGEVGGAETITLTTSQMPSHSHSMSHDHAGQSHSHGMTHDHASDPHTHSVPSSGDETFQSGTGGSRTVSNSLSGSTGSATQNVRQFTGNTASATAGVAAYSGSTGSAGSGAAVNVMSPYLAVQFIVRALP